MTDPDTFIVENEKIAPLKGVHRYYDSVQCIEARQSLQQMVDSPAYDTDSKYYSDDMPGFVERHLQYLSTHSVKNLDGYISNLKLMTKVKQAN